MAKRSKETFLQHSPIAECENYQEPTRKNPAAFKQGEGHSGYEAACNSESTAELVGKTRENMVKR